VAAHFPLPYAEIAADIVAGKIDALETQALAPGLDDPAVLEWYRFLDLGYRLPIVAGTDKMSAEVPVGAVRAYVHLLSDDPLSFDTWAAAVRAGRTFVTSGRSSSSPSTAMSRATSSGCARPGGSRRRSVRAAQPMITDLELIVDDAWWPPSARRGGVTSLELHESVEIGAGAWIAARSRSADVIESAFTTSMAAHTSPVYVEVDGRPFVPRAEAGVVVERIIEGARTWVDELAAVAEPAERTRMVAFLDASLATLRERLGGGR
jgi:hypothetical protein